MLKCSSMSHKIKMSYGHKNLRFKTVIRGWRQKAGRKLHRNREQKLFGRWE